MKLTKNILLVSISITALSFLLSMIISFMFEKSKLNQFTQSWLIGVACSLIVVIITTYLQYKHQEKDIVFELCTNILTLLCCKKHFDEEFDDSRLHVYSIKTGAEIDISKYINNQLETLTECTKLLGEYETFSKVKTIAIERLLYNIGLIIESVAFSTIKDDQYKILCDLDQNRVFTKIAKDTLVITDNICADFINAEIVDFIEAY